VYESQRWWQSVLIFHTDAKFTPPTRTRQDCLVCVGGVN